LSISGDGHSKASVRQVIAWEFMFVAVGGVIGGLTPAKGETIVVDFTELISEEVEKKLFEILKLKWKGN